MGFGPMPSALALLCFTNGAMEICTFGASQFVDFILTCQISETD